MSKVRILYLVEDFKIGGLERVVEAIYNGLDKEKYDPHIWCLAGGGQLADQFHLQGKQIKILGLNSYHRLGNIIKLVILIRKNNFHIVHTHGYFANTFGRIAAFLANSPIIIAHVHTNDVNAKRRHRFIEKKLSMMADRIICCSESVRNFYLEHSRSEPKKTITIYNGVKHQTIQNDNWNTGNVNVVCIASLVNNKGHRYLLEAAKKLCVSSIHNFIIQIVGEGPLKGELIDYARKLGIDDKVSFLGIQENVNTILQAADISVLPSVEREGLGIALIEAMSFGKPVIGTQIGGIPEVIADGVSGLLALPKDSDSLATQLKILIQDKNLRHKLGRNGKLRFLKYFSAVEMVKEIEGLYSDLMNKKKINQKNILYLHNKSKISGGEQSLLNLWKNLDRSRFVPHLLIPSKGPLVNEARILGLKVHYLEVPKWRPQFLYKLVVAFIKLSKYCIINKITIIHSYSPRNNILAALVGKLFGVRVIWHERNMIFGKESDISRKLRFLPDRIICNSKAIAQRFCQKSILPRKVKVIINGVDTHKFQPKLQNGISPRDFIPNGNKVVGLISNLGERKMPEYFIKVCPLILNKHPDTQFLIVGGEFGKNDLGRLNKLRQKAQSLGIGNKIVFTNYREDVADLIRFIDIGVSVTEKEACSRAILELMASGKPVVAFDTGGNAELIKHDVTGRLVEFGDIYGMAKCINELLNNNIRKITMGRLAREIAVNNFDIKINTQQTEQIYSELLN